ncbi:protein of unknown function [Pontibacter chinhatensis]|uniref:DUF202 domain-containing protein n=2 Tax=Pontibacter chinhatensis TaxID=1436961 RepID=A0A1I2TF70_9BACT|nr:protein of unknown function [Pontibacter chinhatensis]
MTISEQDEIKKLKKQLEHQEQKNAEIRDQMAVQRTIFANERTFMAYLRTSLAIVGGGFAALKFSDEGYLDMLGLMAMPLGAALAIYSFYRYLHRQKLIKQQMKEYTHTSYHHAKIHEKEAASYNNTP